MLVRQALADAERHLAVLPGEQAPDDRFDLLADRLEDLAAGDSSPCSTSSSPSRRSPDVRATAARAQLSAEPPGAAQEGAETVVAVRRGGVHDVAVLEEDSLDDPSPRRLR